MGRVMLNIFLSLGFIIFSGVFLIAAQDIPGAGKWDIVGSRSVPQTLLIILLILSIALLVNSVRDWNKKRAAEAGSRTPFSLSDWLRSHTDILLVYVLLFVWICSYNYLGFFVGAFLLMFFLQWWMEDRKFRLLQIVIPLCAAVVCYVLFGRFLAVAFPMGFLDYVL